jgi:hypothetical protein
VTIQVAARAAVRPAAVTALNGSPKSTAPHTVVTGGTRNISAFTVVTPTRSSRYQ